MDRHLKADADFLIIGLAQIFKVLAEVFYAALIILKELYKYFLRGGFARARRAQQSENLPLFYLKGYALQGILLCRRVFKA